LAVAFVASRYGPEGAAEETAGGARGADHPDRSGRLWSLYPPFGTASSGDDDVEFVTLPTGIQISNSNCDASGKTSPKKAERLPLAAGIPNSQL
jgi:hypothetical protein